LVETTDSAWTAHDGALSVLPTGLFGIVSTTTTDVGCLSPVSARAQRFEVDGRLKNLETILNQR